MGNCWLRWRNISTFSQSPNSNPVEEIEERRGGSDLLISSDNSRQVENLNRYAVRNTPIAFTSEEMKSITRPNSRLGGGGFGSVYEGFISKDITREEVVKALSVGDEPLRVAVKVHDGDDSFQGHKEWLAEVNLLGQLSHPNLVKLIGYCCEGDKRILVYEYMPLGNVEEKLFTRVLVPLPWPVRMKIAIGAARGLAFLHGTRQPIIYRDFKTSNILLDHEYNAKISDFGLAKDGPVGDESHVSTRIMGTYGYAAPEYVMTGHLTAGSDVYGFGVVLLELLTGMRTLDMARPAGEQNLVEWTVPMLKEKKKLVRIIDPRLEANYPTKGVQKAAMLAHCCLNRNPKARPTMRDVVYSLEPLQLPADVTHSIVKSPTEC